MTDSGADRPAQADGLEVNEVADGLVVYQAVPERVHYLNNTAAIVFELCDGTRTVDDISVALLGAFGLDRRPVDEVRSCVAELRDQGVVR